MAGSIHTYLRNKLGILTLTAPPLDGPDKLRFFAKLEEPEKRAEYLERVLGELVGNGGLG